MAKITSYTDLNDGTEFTIDLSGSTLALAVAGNLSNDGVTGQAVFSACEDLWKTGATHNRYRFPFAQAVGELAESLELQGGWAELNATTLNLIRDTGLRLRSGYGADATVTEEFCGLVQSGTFGLASTQPYTLLATDTAPADLNYTGEFNELVKVYDSAGDDDRTSLKIYAREEGYTYGYYDLNTSQEVTTILPVSYLIPMSTETDANFTTTYAFIAANTPYTGMSLYTELDGTGFAAWANSTVYAANAVVSDGGRWYSTALGGTSNGTGVGDDTGVTDWTAFAGERDVDGTYYAYNKIIDGNSATKTQIYEYQQYQLRKGNTADINLHASNTDRGETALPLLSWDGTTLITAAGVFVDNYQISQQSDYRFTDVGGVQRSIALVSTTSITNLPAAGANIMLQIYNVTTATEIYAADPGATTYSDTYTEGTDYTSGDDVRIRFAELNGSTSFKSFQTNVTASSTGWSLNAANFIEADSVYATNAVDGSTVTKFSYTPVNDQFNLLVAQNFTAAELFAFYCMTLTTAAGIDGAYGAFLATDPANYKNITAIASIYLDNETTASQRQTDSARIYRDDDAYPVLDPTTSGYGIDVNWQNVVYAFDGGGGGFTSSDRAAQTAIKAKTDSLAFTVANQVDSNVKYVHDVEVDGSGTSGDPWGPV